MITLTGLMGTAVVSRANAEHVGDVRGVVVDVRRGVVTGWQVGKGRNARLVDQAHVTGIGDAVVIDGADSLREPAEGAERQLVKGHGSLLGSLVLADDGTELGTVREVEIDPDSGALGRVTAGDRLIEAHRLRGLGTYALVIEAG